MHPVERQIRRVDSLQQRHVVPGFVFGVIKKYGDDNAGSLTSTIAHSLFGTIFPLLLLLVTILGLIVGSHSELRHALLHSALEQFPIVGTDLRKNISSIDDRSAIAIAIGIIGMVWGSLSLASNGIFTMMQVWNLPGPKRPNYPKRLLRALAFLGVLAAWLVVTSGVTALIALFPSAIPVIVAGQVGVAAVNSAVYLVAFIVLTPGRIAWRRLLPGAVFAGIIWTCLLAAGELIVGHYLRNESAIYGAFAIVLGLFAWLYFAAELTVYSAEINVVLARRLWPRAIVQPPLTEADRRSMAAQAHQNRRRPEQHVQVTFEGEPQLESRVLEEEARKRATSAPN